jgi:hypothetical protein
MTSTILPTLNEEWGFFGTIGRSESAAADPATAWEIAFRKIAETTGAAAQAARPGDQIDEAAAFARLMIEPDPRTLAGDDEGQAALSPPAPLATGLQLRRPEQLDGDLRHAGAQLGIERLPVPRHQPVLRQRACPRPGAMPEARAARLAG